MMEFGAMMLGLAAQKEGVRSFAVNAENPTGEKGRAASTASALGPGRKGSPAWVLEPGEVVTLLDLDGPGVIRHIWITVPEGTAAGPYVLRDLVLRMYWDGEDVPSVVAPLGDFFCSGFGRHAIVDSLPFVVAPKGGMNCYIPLPFLSHARVTLTSEHPGRIESCYFQFDGTLGDDVSGLGRLRALWRRSNGDLPKGSDFEILPRIVGRGAYLGAYLNLCSLERSWWGEGEVKFYIDGDRDLPSLCSTGLEDYVGGAWAFQDRLANQGDVRAIEFSSHSFGYPYTRALDDTGSSPFVREMPSQHAMYRWHLLDPIFFHEDLRVTVQMIGANDFGLFERSDDVSSVAYWYQWGGEEMRREFPGRAERLPR